MNKSFKQNLNSKIKVTFIGAGAMCREHIKVYEQIKDVEIKGIYSRTKEKAISLSKEFNSIKVYDSIKDLYEDTQADLVVITVSVESIFKVCEEAVNYNWILLVEKPVGLNYKEALKITEIANSKNSKLFVALNRRYYSSTLKLQEILNNYDNKRIVNIVDQQDLGIAKSMGYPKNVLKNWMYANSIHLVDYLTIFCRGSFEKINVINRWDSSNPDFVMAKITFSSGDVGIFQSFWKSPSNWSVVVNTKDCRGELSPLEKLKMQFGSSRKFNIFEEDIVDLKYKPGLFNQAENIVNFLKGSESKTVSIKEANKSMFLVSKIFEVG